MSVLLTKVRKAGGARIITLPAPLFEETHWDVGEELELRVEGGYVGMCSTRKPTLEELMALVPEGGLPTFEELEGWTEPSKPVGREAMP